MSDMIPRYERYSPSGSNNNGGLDSASTAVRSFSDGGWWTQEEARLYEQWATGYSRQGLPANSNPYFDYFYTGQDVRIKIDALDDNEYLPIYSFGYQIQQEKQPLYGYASYTYDAVLRGSRIISGAFSLVVTEPRLLSDQIARSAQRRAETTESESTYALRNFDGDRSNIERYWRRNYDFNLDAGDKHLFSIHPPFNLVIKYGVQETSLIIGEPSDRANQIRESYEDGSDIWTNVNERLVYPTGQAKTNILLENIELTTKSIEYDPNGDPLLETYSFIARDERLVDDSSTMDVPIRLPRNRPITGAGGGTINNAI